MSKFFLVTSDIFVVIFTLIFLITFIAFHRSPSLVPPPPGPKPLPIVGNAFQFPRVDPHLKYREWRQLYGDIVHLTAAGKHIVILNSAKVTFELLEKRGRIYSERPHSVMVSMVGLDDTWSLHPYDDKLRQFRKLGRQVMGERAIKMYQLTQEEEARFFIKAVMESPDDLVGHVNRVTSSIVLRLLYGYSPSSELDALSVAAQKLVKDVSKLVTAGSRLLDLFPFLRYVPAWFPLASFQRTAADLSKVYQYIFDTPFATVKRSLDRVGETHTPVSICATLLQDESNGPLPSSKEEDLIRMFLGSLYPPGQETMASTLTTFFMLMATHPEVQAKAKAEIMSVVGDHRLPTLSDRQSLVYLEAIIKEVLRWHSVVPLGLPHRLVTDDVYDGFLLPKDSIVFPNVWEMMHDPEVYPDPFSFLPERFVGTGDKTDSGFSYSPYAYVFGFGRRSCPGIHMAEGSLFIIMATILAISQIEECQDASGTKIRIEPKFTPTLVTHLLPFRCSVKPQSQNAINLLQHALDGARTGYRDAS